MLRLTDDPLGGLLRSQTPTRPHAIVIGSGFGDLAAAVRLGARGYRVTVLEKLDQFGGRARVFRQDGFTFDAGPTIITAPFLFDELWDADSAWTYRHLVPAHARKRWTDRKIARSRYSMSLFVWYFGTSRRYEDVQHHTILLGPRYRELLRDIFDCKILAEDFSLYLHRPTASDPSLAPDGCDSFYVLSPVPHLEADVDWTQRAESYRLAVSRYLEAALLPGLEENIVTSRIMTPLHFRDELSSVNGAAFGLEPIMTQSAWFRPHNASEDIDGLYLVGAGTHPGAGLPGVLSSARVLDQVVPHAHAFA